ncbi:MAG TPA: hypothetical protein VNZ86_17905 [Bacteroidia bacterium]|nr:hypothetical protein [Bacteroidia bacterium]
MICTMKKMRLILLCSALTVLASCISYTTKSRTSSASVEAPVQTKATGSVLLTPSENGVSIPGNAELKAIQLHYKEATMDQLKEGYRIYTEDACVSCHEPKNIYDYELGEWKDIMDEMARKAKISDQQKEVVYKYVLAIKATQYK